jgi:Fe-coproporphyrin III synthase
LTSKPDDLYPSLGGQVRLKKMPSCCWVVDGLSNGERIHPLEAFILALCTGEHSLSDIVYLVQRTLDKSFDWSEQLVTLTLGKRAKYLRVFGEGAPRNLRYEPAEYLYPTQRTPRAAEGRLDSPGELILILTHHCNFRCIYCFNSSAPGKSHAMPASDWLRVLSEAKEHDVVRCTISGGEPMTHPGFREILTRIMSYDMIPYVCTNGSLIESEDVQYFSSIGLPCIQVSLDTVDEATHDRMSQARGSLVRVRTAIRALIDAGIDVFVKSVITPINFPNLEDLIDCCHDWGIKRLTLDRFDLSNAGRGNQRLFLSPAMEKKMGEVARERQLRYGKDGFAVTAVDQPRCWLDRGDIIVCGALSTGMTILPDGHVSLCEKLIDYPDLTVGDVRRQTVGEVWNSPRVQAVLRPPEERIDPVCRECPEFHVCHTGCFAQTLIVTNEPFAPDPRCWRANYQNSPYLKYATGGASHG